MRILLSHLTIAIRQLKRTRSTSIIDFNIMSYALLGAWLTLLSGCDSIESIILSNHPTDSDSVDISDTQYTQGSQDNDSSNHRVTVSTAKPAQPNEQILVKTSTDVYLAYDAQRLDNTFLNTYLPALKPLLNSLTQLSAPVVFSNNDIKQIKSQLNSAYSEGCAYIVDDSAVHMPQDMSVTKHDESQSSQLSSNSDDASQMVNDILAITPTVLSNQLEDYPSVQGLIYEHITQSGSVADNCYYANIHTLTFEPKMEWIEGIEWKNIAFIISPKLTLKQEGELDTHHTAQIYTSSSNNKMQNLVMSMLEDIKQGERNIRHLPLEQLIVTDIHFNDPNLTENDTAYLTIHSIQKQNEVLPKLYYQHTIMLDMNSNKSLELPYILDINGASLSLLQMLQQSKKHWLIASQAQEFNNSELDQSQFGASWPLHLPKQWYLNDEGLHLVYQPGEVISDTLPINMGYNKYIVDVLVPVDAVNELLKPEYKLNPQSALNSQIVEQADDTAISDAYISVNFLPIDVDNVTQPLINRVHHP